MKEVVTYKKKLKQVKTDEEIVSQVYTNVKDGRAWKKTKVDDLIAKWEQDYRKDALGNEQDGRSTLIDDTIHNFVQSVITNIQEPIMNTSDIVRLTSNSVDEDVMSQAKMEEALLNYQFTTRVDKFALMDESVKLFVRQGIVASKAYWNHKVKQIVAESLYEPAEDIAEYEDVPMNAYEELLIAHKAKKEYPVDIEENEDGTINVTFVYDNVISENPDFYNVPISNMFWDETARKVSYTNHDMQYVGEVKIMTESDIRSKMKVDKTYRKFSKDDMKQLFAARDISEAQEAQSGYETMDGGMQGYYQTLNKDILKDGAGVRQVVIEYHGYLDVDDSGIAQLVHLEVLNGKIIKLELNTEIDDMIPYNVAMFDKDPFTITGESIPSYLRDVQYLRTAMLRGMHDSIAYGLSQNYAMEEGAMSPSEEKRFRTRKPGEIVKFKKSLMGGNIKDRLVNIQSEGLKGEHMTMYNLAEQQAQENSGVTAYTQGLNSEALNQTATGVSIITNMSMKRMWRYATGYIEQSLKPMIKASRIMNKTLLDPIEFTLNDETYNISKEDIDIDSDITTSVVIKGFDSEKVNQIIQFLNLGQPLVGIGAFGPDVLTECAKELAEIWDMRSIQNMIKAIQVPPYEQALPGGQGTAEQPSDMSNRGATSSPTLPGNNTIEQM